LRLRRKCGYNYPSALLCAFVGSSTNDSYSFDTDSLELIIDTGASAAFTFCKQDFIEFQPLTDSVKGLATLKIQGVGTVQYNIKNDQGKTVSMIIRNCYYVPEMDIRLISPQQLAQQSKKKCEHSFNDKVFHLRWNGHTKTVPFSKKNNLPTLYTSPGTALAANIAHHMDTHSANPSIRCLRAAKTVPSFALDGQTAADDHEYVSV